MAATFFSPVTHLTFISGLCPCLEREEDRNARLALRSLQRQSVVYFRGGATRSSWTTRMASLTSLLPGSKGQAEVREPSQGRARLVLRDNGDSDPEILVVSHRGQTIQNVAVGRIDRVVLEESTGHVLLLGRPPLDRHGKQEGPPKEELRLLFVQEGSSDEEDEEDAPMPPSQEVTPSAPSYLPVSNDARNSLIHHLQVFIEWERQRRSDLALDPLDEEPNFLRKKAQTAARFAERELELRETTRARAERKAKLVAQAGGLKYTALAMAKQGGEMS